MNEVDNMQAFIKLNYEQCKDFYDSYDKNKRAVSFDLFYRRHKRGIDPHSAIVTPYKCIPNSKYPRDMKA